MMEKTSTKLKTECSFHTKGNIMQRTIFNYSFIHLGYFYSASSSPLLLGGTPDTARILRPSFTLKRHGRRA